MFCFIIFKQNKKITFPSFALPYLAYKTPITVKEQISYLLNRPTVNTIRTKLLKSKKQKAFFN